MSTEGKVLITSWSHLSFSFFFSYDISFKSSLIRYFISLFLLYTIIGVHLSLKTGPVITDWPMRWSRISNIVHTDHIGTD